jgi:primosomal protein N' (replication factor Y)
MEAAAWAGPKRSGGRVLIQSRTPGAPAIQALVRWDPLPFLLRAGEDRARAGFPPNHPVYRVDGPPDAGLVDALRAFDPTTLLETPGPSGTVCLVAVRPEDLEGFRAGVLDLVAAGVVTRVEAEPTV